MGNGNDAPNRWWITTATFLVMFPIGGIYAWSVFVEPLQQQFDWGWTQSMAPLMVNVAFIFVGTFVGGKIQDRTGPKWVAVTGIVVYCVGVALATLARSPEHLRTPRRDRHVRGPLVDLRGRQPRRGRAAPRREAAGRPPTRRGGAGGVRAGGMSPAFGARLA